MKAVKRFTLLTLSLLGEVLKRVPRIKQSVSRYGLRSICFLMYNVQIILQHNFRML